MDNIILRKTLSAEFIADAQNEVIMQLNKVKKVLNKYKDFQEEFSVGESVVGGKSQRSIEDIIEEIDQENRKIEQLQLTLAFVGTMKAGKSMTINAIIGQEVLPNRSTAMTVLPTVITHVTGKAVPELVFPFKSPFDNAIREIKKKLADLDREHGKYQCVNPDLNKAIQHIRSGILSGIKEKYVGAEGIYNFMECLNDIARICALDEFDIKSPLDEYAELSQFPEIEVEFTYFKGRHGDKKGELSLIDTPGPNEAGQGRLKAIVKEQLRNASAVVSVLDYTQLNTDADEEVRSWIKEIRESVGTELFVFVNKFDQRTSKSMKKEDTIEYIENYFFGDDGDRLSQSIKGRIYTISSKRGFYANVALQRLERDGKLPSPDKEEWVQDYAEAAYGMEWFEDLEDDDIDKHKKASERMWKISNLAEPLEKVIERSLENAVPKCLEAGLVRVKGIVTEMENSFIVTKGSLSKNIKELEGIVKKLQKNLDNINGMKKKAQAIRESSQEEIEDLVNRSILEIHKLSEKSPDESVKEESNKLMVSQSRKEAAMSSSMGLLTGMINSIFGTGSRGKTAESTKKFINSKEPLKFDEKRDAEKFVTEVISDIGKKVDSNMQRVLKDVKKPINDVQLKLKRDMEEVLSPILEEAKATIRENFSIELEFAEPEFKEIALDLDSIENENIKKGSERRSYTSYERKWYTLWLYEHEVVKYYDQDIYIVDPAAIMKKIEVKIKKAQEDISGMVKAYINEIMEEKVNCFFRDINLVIGRVNTDIENGIKIQQQGQEMQVRAIENLSCLASEAAVIKRQNLSVKEGFDELFRLK